MEDITEDDVDKTLTENLEQILNQIHQEEEEAKAKGHKRSARADEKLEKLAVTNYEKKLVGLSGGGSTAPPAYMMTQGHSQLSSGRKEEGTQTIEQMMSARMTSARGSSASAGGTSARGGAGTFRGDRYAGPTLGQISERDSGNESARQSMTKGFGFNTNTIAKSSGTGPFIPPINTNKHKATKSPSEIIRSTLQEHGSGAVTDHMISALKSLGPSHPEVLAKWRSDRASGFISTQKHPLDPPTQRDMTERVFRPAGTFVSQPPKELPGRKAGGGGAGYTLKKKPVEAQPYVEENTARMKETLDSLMQQLTKTENEIERQKLKIALKRKNKHYETSKG
jgi:hypothetical protein